MIAYNSQLQSIANSEVGNGDTPPSPTRESTINRNEVEKYKQKIDSLYDQVLKITEDWPNADITVATDYLMYSAKELETKTPNLVAVNAYFARAKMWYARLNRKKHDSRRWGSFLAISIQFVYLIILVLWAATFYGGHLNKLPTNLDWLDVGLLENVANFVSATIISTEFIRIPFYTIVWGFLGGVAWCLYTATYWTDKGLFNNNYIGWYISLPFIGALLGAAASTVILGGYTAIAFPTGNSEMSLTGLPFAVTATLCLVSFTAGYSSRYIWKMLDRTMRNIFKDESEVLNVRSSAEQYLMESKMEKDV